MGSWLTAKSSDSWLMIEAPLQRCGGVSICQRIGHFLFQRQTPTREPSLRFREKVLNCMSETPRQDQSD